MREWGERDDKFLYLCSVFSFLLLRCSESPSPDNIRREIRMWGLYYYEFIISNKSYFY